MRNALFGFTVAFAVIGGFVLSSYIWTLILFGG